MAPGKGEEAEHPERSSNHPHIEREHVSINIEKVGQEYGEPVSGERGKESEDVEIRDLTYTES